MNSIEAYLSLAVLALLILTSAFYTFYLRSAMCGGSKHFGT
jgi:uncharacterized membrane protein